MFFKFDNYILSDFGEIKPMGLNLVEINLLSSSARKFTGLVLMLNIITRYIITCIHF